jgi:hypothetical protein
VTRPVTTPACVHAGQTPIPGTMPDSHLRNAGWSDRINPDLATTLSWEPVPAYEEIAAQEKFTVETLTAEAFESVWSRASDSSAVAD